MMTRLKFGRAGSFWLLATLLVLLSAASSAPSPPYAVYAARWHFSPITLTAIFGVYALALPGVIAVLSHENAPRLAPVDDAELAVFQSEAITYYGQFVAAVVAETLEMARQAAELVVVRYEEQPHDVELRADRTDLYKPQIVSVVCRISIRFFLPITFRRTVLEQLVEQINTMRQRMSPAT
jgi:hypothetical protein